MSKDEKKEGPTLKQFEETLKKLMKHPRPEMTEVEVQTMARMKKLWADGAPPDYVVINADFSSMELRVMADLAKDRGYPIEKLLNLQGTKTGRLSSHEEHLSNLPKCRHGKSGKSEDCFGCTHDFDPCAEGCKGWLHMDEPYEIQACDECCRFMGSDIALKFTEVQARIAHKAECGCAWPDFDYRHAAYAWLYDIEEFHDSTDLLQSSNANVLRNFVETDGQRFMDNIIPIIFLCTQMIDREKGDIHCKKAIGGMMALMKDARDKIASKELTLKDFEEHSFDWKDGKTKDDYDSPTDKL